MRFCEKDDGIVIILSCFLCTTGSMRSFYRMPTLQINIQKFITKINRKCIKCDLGGVVALFNTAVHTHYKRAGFDSGQHTVPLFHHPGVFM